MIEKTIGEAYLELGHLTAKIKWLEGNIKNDSTIADIVEFLGTQDYNHTLTIGTSIQRLYRYSELLELCYSEIPNNLGGNDVY